MSATERKFEYGFTAPCNLCGDVSVIVDCYIPYGRPEDMEPPDEVWMCKKCAEKEIENIKLTGILPEHWIFADFEMKLAREMGWDRRNNKWVKMEDTTTLILRAE